ncbi:MAG: 30S ribosomal protein S8 [Candidatus Diapherotrites archaeon]|nr:30S ribosomal protein S8 [Candidatus Diapherotrites archaeon]
MSLNDPIANALISIKNSDKAVQGHCYCKPASKLLARILEVMKANGYITQFERVDDQREGIYKIELAGKINEARVIKPRHAVKKNEFDKYEKRYLPSRDIGILIVSTPEGVLTHREVKSRGLGGRLLAYIY